MSLRAQEAGVCGNDSGWVLRAGDIPGQAGRNALPYSPPWPIYAPHAVIAAGGISDYRGFLAALALGPAGVEMGPVSYIPGVRHPSVYKDALGGASDTGTLVVGQGAMTLRLLRNPASESLKDLNGKKEEENSIVDYMSGDGDLNRTIMPAGQGAGLVKAVEPIGTLSRNLSAGPGTFPCRSGKLLQDD